ncbi:hypothetical protein PRIPAC_87037 [Pristionchus pacificus]|uniref:Uncharacterized protein n=1 Tax=Pristionchus pacificus TaxID=54126 RepID=A0A2A6BT40_PRIPA|nr:hypothetical protein PRIPAC_87037 [Pristionchus pacificus]|eukprot:PDM68973.1 hypothetical protein PRIPAC_47275 [Pristionchus pacificus]
MRVPAWWIIATGWVSEKSFLIWGVLVMGALHGLLIASIIINFQMPNMADEWAVEVNEAVDVAPASELESDLPEVQLFGKWSRQEVNFADISLVDYIAVKENLIK